MGDNHPLSILIVDDSEFMRVSLKALIKKVPEFALLGEAADGETAIDLATKLKPEVALVDLGLPGLSGIEVTKQIKQALPATRVLILTASNYSHDIFSALDAGADGYILKGDFSLKLESAISMVQVGSVWLDPGLAREVLRAAERITQERRGQMALSQQEREVLDQVAQSDCTDGVCLVNSAFLMKLKRFKPAEDAMEKVVGKDS